MKIILINSSKNIRIIIKRVAQFIEQPSNIDKEYGVLLNLIDVI